MAEAFLALLLRRHPNRPEHQIAGLLELLDPLPTGEAVAVIAAALSAGLPETRYLEVLLTQRHTTPADPPTAPPLTEPALPALDVERPLSCYAHVLTQPKRKETDDASLPETGD